MIKKPNFVRFKPRDYPMSDRELIDLLYDRITYLEREIERLRNASNKSHRSV